MRALAVPALVATMAIGLAGCYESPTATVYEPGEYKGKKDPLMMEGADQRAEVLEERFNQVQTDR